MTAANEVAHISTVRDSLASVDMRLLTHAVQGVLVTLAIGFHNIPEGLAVATVLVARGVSAKSALTWYACLHQHPGSVMRQERVLKLHLVPTLTQEVAGYIEFT